MLVVFYTHLTYVIIGVHELNSCRNSMLSLVVCITCECSMEASFCVQKLLQILYNLIAFCKVVIQLRTSRDEPGELRT